MDTINIWLLRRRLSPFNLDTGLLCSFILTYGIRLLRAMLSQELPVVQYMQMGDTIEPRVLVKAVTPASVTLQETRSQVERAVLLAGEGK